MASNIVWGLDIGNSAIKAVKMQKSGGECSIVDFDIIDIPGGDDPADRPARLNLAMKNLTDTHKFGNDPVFLAIPGSVCLHREFSLPPGAESKLAELVQFEAKQQIPFPLDQVEWGYERYDSTDGSNAVNVTLIAVRKSDIQELLTLSESFNLKLVGIGAAPMALYNFINYEFHPQQTTLILDSGSKGTDFVVMNKRQIYFRNIQIAGREITRVLENKFKVPFDKAENLKKNIAQSPQMDQILTVIEPTLRNLGADVQRTIGFYKAKSKGQKIQQCYLLGHTFRLPKMAEFLQTQIREAPFAIVEGLQRIHLAPQVARDVWEHEFPTMAVAIGLGVQGLGLSELTLNLIPQEKESEIARSAWKRWAAASVIAVLITLGVIYFLSNNAAKFYTDKSEEAGKVLKKVKESNEAEATASRPIADKVLLLKRLSKVLRDRGKQQQIENTILNIKSETGTVLGTNSRVYLTSIYVSRVPFLTTLKSDHNRDRVDQSEIFKRFFGPLAAGPEPLPLAPELRPDAPLMVVVSGEVHVVDGKINDALEKLKNLEDAIKNLKEVKEFTDDKGNKTKIEHEINAQTPKQYDETKPEYGYDGKVKPKPEGVAAPPEPPEVIKHSAIQFNLLFQWEDPEDKDIEPADKADAPAAVKKP